MDEIRNRNRGLTGHKWSLKEGINVGRKRGGTDRQFAMIVYLSKVLGVYSEVPASSKERSAMISDLKMNIRSKQKVGDTELRLMAPGDASGDPTKRQLEVIGELCGTLKISPVPVPQTKDEAAAVLYELRGKLRK